MAATAAATACRRAVSYTLNGPPPEFFRVAATAVDKAAAPAATAATATAIIGRDKYAHLLDDYSFRTAPDTPPPPPTAQPARAKTRTENNSPTFASSGDPCLDFFFHVVPDTPAASVVTRLAVAWAAEPLTALRLACNLRGVTGTGKSDREGFYAGELWIHDRHPKTLALNARAVAGFGYLKDLPEILHRIIHGGVPTTGPRRARPAASHRSYTDSDDDDDSDSDDDDDTEPDEVPEPAGDGAKVAEEDGVAAEEEDARKKKMKAEVSMARQRRRAVAAARALDRYSRDANYRFLYDRTVDVFAELLAEDMRKLADGKLNELSLAAKWRPSIDCSYDRSTLLCEAIGRRLFPRGSSPELPEDLDDRHYTYRVRELLRKRALTPLRRALSLPEVFISDRAWGDVVYTRVASVAMNNYRELFAKHDSDRFKEYLEDVKAGKATIAAGALLPHEIIASIIDDDDGGGAVANLQWERMVSDLRELGKLCNCIPICDVSGSMYGGGGVRGRPIEVSIALGLLVSELGEEPWRHHLITFSEQPQMHQIAGETLEEKVRSIQEMDGDLNTNFQAVFDKLLDVAVAGKLPPERMVKRVIVFSDMEFDVASANPRETDYEAIRRKFTEAGYGEAVPEIVFWNLRESKSVPVTSGQKGVALVSGFSKNLIKLFLDSDGIVSPRDVMEKAISGPEYQELAIYD